MPLFPVRSDEQSAAFLAGAARGEFLIVRDQTTGQYLDSKFDADMDTERFERIPAAGTGSIVSWSVVHGRGADGATRTVIAIVQLDEGPWWWTEVVGADPESDLQGARVAVEFVRTGPDVLDAHIPQFRLSN